MNLESKALVLAAAVFLIGCGDGTKVAALEGRVAALEKQLSSTTPLEKQVADLQQKLEFQQMINTLERTAFLTPGSDGYSVIKSDFGHLTVAIGNIQPYANGSKITLVFGNLTAATIDGLKGKLEWGAVDKNGFPNNAEAKSRDVSFNEPLISGGWTKSDVVLEGIPPTDLGFVRLKDVGHRGVRLRR